MRILREPVAFDSIWEAVDVEGRRDTPRPRGGGAARDLDPLAVADRLLHRLAEREGTPSLGEDEYWFDPSEVSRWLDDGVFYLVSPLDTANMTEVELTEEQEEFLGWLNAKGVAHVRIAP